jgi:hypothetical protein
MRLGIAAALVLLALGLSSCMAARQRGTTGGETASQPVIRPVAQVPAQAQAQPLTRPRAIYVADFDIDPSIVQTSTDLPRR